MRSVALVLALAATLASAASAAPRTVELTIIHYYRGCHVWTPDGVKPLGPTVGYRLKRGDRVRIVDRDVMQFDWTQTAGPRVLFAYPRTSPGERRLLVFRKPGVYRFVGHATDTSDHLQLQTIGPDNVLVLVVRVG